MIGEKNVAVIDCTMPIPAARAGRGDALRANLDRIRAEAEDAALRGCATIVLTDEGTGPDRVALPMILATGGVHASLVAKGLRSYVSIIVRSAECLDTHYFAVLVGVGATAVNAYLAQESFQDRLERGLTGELTLRDLCLNFKTPIEGGLLKIISKMGICGDLLVSRRLQLRSRGPVARPGRRVLPRHALAHLRHRPGRPRRPRRWSCTARPGTRRRISLPVGGFYKAAPLRRGPRLRGADDPHPAARLRHRRLPGSSSAAPTACARIAGHPAARPARLRARPQRRSASTTSRASTRSASAS